jgi:sec-independent protein translocase protein TatA
MSTLAFIPNIGPLELIVLLVILLLLFGRRLPEVGRSVGRGIVEFRKGLHGIEREIEDATREPPAAPRQEPPRPPLTERLETTEDPRISRTPAHPGTQP